ncbi:MAG: cell division protein ZapA [Syntrophales bacterium]|nr:cell division protein ZapA [Syntrophales bacterium]
MKKRFNIKILGQELSVVSDSGDEHVANVVRYVNNKVEEIGKASSNINTLNVAIMVALNIADEHFKFEEVNRGIYSQLESRSEELINLIDEIN